MTPDLLTKYYALAALESERGYEHFLKYVTVDAQPKKRPFRTIAEPWQWERAMRSAPAIDNLAKITSGYPGPFSFWNGYHKGSDKTHDNARELCFLLGWSRTPLNCYVCAGSEDQASLITTAMTGILRDNPWIADRVTVSKLTGRGLNGSTLTVLPQNAWTGQGIFPDLVVAIEITHWAHAEGKRFWDFILESVNKRPHCVLKVETNAGVKNTWQWDERNRIERSPFWSFFEAPVGRPLPTWLNQAKIDDDSQGLSPGERDRLYGNRWIDPGEEHGYLLLAECLTCRDPNLVEQARGRTDREYVLVVDYGGVADRCALGVLHVEPGAHQAIVDRLDCWQGSHDARIDILIDPADPDRRSVEGWIETVLKNFWIGALVLDPYQLESLAIRYERKGRRVCRYEYRGGKGNMRMAQMLKTAVQSRSVRWSPDAGRLPSQYLDRGKLRRIEDMTLEQELSSLVVKKMGYGYRFDHESGRHDDRATVIGMGLVQAFPEGVPVGWLGPKVVEDDRGTRPIGATPTTRGGELNEGVSNWKLFGINGAGGSAWQSGDIG